MSEYDVIIVGGGHNGLICASYLARSGKRVLVLEATDVVGGMASPQSGPAGITASLAHTMTRLPDRIVDDLSLRAHGYRPTPVHLPMIAPGKDGNHIVLMGGRVTGVSQKDTDAFAAFHAQMQRHASVFRPLWLQTPPRLAKLDSATIKTYGGMALRMRMLGADDMREFLRVIALPMSDLLDEWFDDPRLKAIICWDGLIGSRLAPNSPNHGVLNYLFRLPAAESGGVEILRHSNGPIPAIVAAARAAGAEIRTSARVARITVKPGSDGLHAAGVELETGETCSADIVVSATHPKNTFLDLVGQKHLEVEFANRIRRIRSAGMVAKAHFIVSSVQPFVLSRLADARIIIAPSMEDIEQCFDQAKHGEIPSAPVLEVTLPTMADSETAPKDNHLVSVHAMYVPSDPKCAWDHDERLQFLGRIASKIDSYCPGFSNSIVAHELLTPQDIASKYGVSGGHWHHGELALDQMMMMRPTYEAAQYRTPIRGLFLCSAGSHPGGGITGVPGHNAAREILK